MHRRLTLAERQEFILQGEAWKHTQVNPLDNLKVAQLQTELEKRGYNTRGKKKVQLEREFDELRKGVSNVPAILQQTPKATLESLNLDNYEVFATELLHDLKGHARNIIEERTKRASGETKQVLKNLQATVLGKTTLRCSDYRKALVIIYKSLKQCTNPDTQIVELFRTACEICEIMYAPDSRHTPKAILRLHNLTYQHGKICVDLFTQSSTTTAVYGRYFNSIICHSPPLLRIVCLRSVNTEVQERMFGQVKQITRGTSSLKANHIITNIITRLQAETNVRENSLTIQEGEVRKLANTLGPTVNSVIPYSWIEQNPSLHQAYLERISDFLLPGPGVWWRHSADGIEFLDGHECPSQQPQGPDIHHLRSTSLSEIDIYLQKKWEECCYTHTISPAKHIRQYQPDGSLSAITSSNHQGFSPTHSVTPMNMPSS